MSNYWNYSPRTPEAAASRWVEWRADLLMDAMDLADGAEANLPAIAEAGAKIEAIKRRADLLLNAVPPEYARM